MFKNKTIFYHFLATVTIIIWGTTYVSTKVLIKGGLSPVEIFLYRFLLAYLCTLSISYKKLWAGNYKDEFWLFLAGVSGGSFFFLAENTALSYTLASNVALLICTSPLITIVLTSLLYKTPIGKKAILGSLIALFGVALVVFDGKFALDVNILGDTLTIFASFLWAVYCLVMKKLSSKYDTLFITRKVFFYGIVSLCFYFPFFPIEIKTEVLIQPIIWSNLLFLALIASMLCYIMWNYAVKQLGASKTANYIYLIPFSTIITSSIFLGEIISFSSLIGAFCILTGVYIAERKK